MREVKLWFNEPQKKSLLILAKEEYGVWGRATGKTQGPIAYRTIWGANSMPRGATGIVGASYSQLLDRTLSPLIKAWRKFGYEENVHFWRQKYPPKDLQIPQAIYPVLTPEHSIFWYNGHVFHLISQDRPGLANGKNLDAIVCDEARFLNYQRYMEDVAPTNRGNREVFGHLAHHHMVTMFTDMPTNASGKWILEKEKQVDAEKIKLIINLQVELNQLELEYQNPFTLENRKDYLLRKIKEYDKVLNELRRNSVFYSEASSLANIEILGTEQFKQWRRELDRPEFEASVLNKRVIHTDNGFYNLLDVDVHGYSDFDTPKITQNNCSNDFDLIKNKPLDIALDYNAAINSLVIGQETDRFFRIIKSMFATSKQKKILPDLIDDFCSYYDPHNCHEVFYYYDHTAIATDSTRLRSLADIVMDQFRENGWTVYGRYIGQQPRHDTRYRMWQNVLKENDPKFKSIRLNLVNAHDAVVSMQLAGVRVGKNGFEKDKRSEANKLIPPQHATHFTDATDTLIVGKFQNTYGYSPRISELIIV